MNEGLVSYPQGVFVVFVRFGQQRRLFLCSALTSCSFLATQSAFSLRQELDYYILRSEISHFKVVPWVRRLGARLSPRRPGFDRRLLHVDEVALGQAFLILLRIFPVIIPLMPNIHLSFNTPSSEG